MYSCLKIDTTHLYDNDLLLRQEGPCRLVWVYVWSGFCMDTYEDLSLRFFAMMTVKDQVLGNVFGLLPTESLTLTGHLVVNFLPDLEFSAFLLRLVYWLIGLKFVYPTIKLTFLGIVVKVPAKFCLHIFEWFCLQISNDATYFFLSCPRHSDWGLIVFIVSYFQIWNKKKTLLLVVELTHHSISPGPDIWFFIKC